MYCNHTSMAGLLGRAISQNGLSRTKEQPVAHADSLTQRVHGESHGFHTGCHMPQAVAFLTPLGL